jgi:phosphatidylethanolamine-binding protein (PEBP) family uncharacterized protein
VGVRLDAGLVSGLSDAGDVRADADVPARFELAPAYEVMVDAKHFAFPVTARPPRNVSPAFTWRGVPSSAKSLVLVFRDVTDDTPPVKWVLWDMPPSRTGIPAGLGSAARPPLVPGASQLGSRGNQGYAGPCCVGNRYEWVIYALNVEKLPVTRGLTTAQIYSTVLPRYTISKSDPVLMQR